MSVPFVYAPDLKAGVHEALSSRISRLIAGNPGPFTYTGSGTYLLTGDEDTIIIDPGPDDEGHLSLLDEVAPSPIRAILITHTHQDHSGGAMRLRAATGAEIYGFGPHPSAPGKASPALDEGADFAFAPDHRLTDGQVLSWPGLTIEAVHTPGHIGNHLCFALKEEDALFTGDHIMGWATTVVAPPDGDMAAYMASLDKLIARDDRIYYPTHGVPITEPLDFVRAVKEHRLGRDQAILTLLDEQARSIPELVDAIYTDLSPALKFAAGLNVQAHLEMHLKEGRVSEDTGTYRLT